VHSKSHWTEPALKEEKMRLKIVLLAALFLAFSPAGFAQSNESQPLRRYVPRMQSTQQDFGQDTLSVSSEKGIPLSTKQALIRYVTEHYKVAQLIVDIYRVRDADNLYFVIGTFNADRQAEDSPMQSVLLALRERGGVVSEVSKATSDSDAAIKVPAFFLGRNKVLIIVSHSAPDGSFAGHYVYEYADNKLKPLGEIPVIDRTGTSGSVWITNNRVGVASAEYKNSAYYVTLRGKGTLYQPAGDGANYKKLAAPGAPVTFSYNKGAWRPVTGRKIRPGRRASAAAARHSIRATLG